MAKKNIYVTIPVYSNDDGNEHNDDDNGQSIDDFE